MTYQNEVKNDTGVKVKSIKFQKMLIYNKEEKGPIFNGDHQTVLWSVDDALSLLVHNVLQQLNSTKKYARVLFIDFSSAIVLITTLPLDEEKETVQEKLIPVPAH